MSENNHNQDLLEPALFNRYNEGLVSPPELVFEPTRPPRPAWQPEPAQIRLAREQLFRSSLILGLLVFGCLLLVVFATGWRP
jgi:hypothetical protein